MRWKTGEYRGWGRVLTASGQMARPEKISQLRAILNEAPGPAIGNRRSYGDAPLNSGGPAIDMTRLDRLLAFDAKTGVLSAEAGVTIAELLRVFAPLGWIPAVMPGTGFATLGGAIANDVHGKNHHDAGSFGAHVVSIDLLGANGRQRRITPEKNATLFRATIGGLGQTGVIVAAAIRLVPCASEIMSVRETRQDTLDEFMATLESSTASYSVGWIDATAKGRALGRGILEEGEIAPPGATIKPGKPRSIPRDAPRFFLSAPIVRLFNQVYLRRVPPEGRTRDRRMDDFFFPLDRIHNWNRLYGKPGFHQFQCVLPPETAHETLTDMIGQIAKSGLASPLAVLKRLGPGGAGIMSFPMEGYTLAVDFPNREKAAALIAALNDKTIKANGRIYLAKDSLASAEGIAKMYPDLDAFRACTNAQDPSHIFETDMIRRLGLRNAS